MSTGPPADWARPGLTGQPPGPPPAPPEPPPPARVPSGPRGGWTHTGLAESLRAAAR